MRLILNYILLPFTFMFMLGRAYERVRMIASGEWTGRKDQGGYYN